MIFMSLVCRRNRPEKQGGLNQNSRPRSGFEVALVN
jgi:hypothetical protein